MGKLQRAVVETVWEMGEATVRQVWERLCPGKEVSYTTILAAMQRMEKSGWLRHRTEGKSNVYRPTRTPEQAGASSINKFVQRMFDGNALLMFRHLKVSPIDSTWRLSTFMPRNMGMEPWWRRSFAGR